MKPGRLYSVGIAALFLAGGCVTAPSVTPPSVESILHGTRPPSSAISPLDLHLPDPGVPRSEESTSVAEVNGRPIDRVRLVDLLMAAHGPSLLEQLAVMEAAQKAVEEAGLTLSPDRENEEYDRALAQLMGSTVQGDSPVAPGTQARRKAEELLAEQLKERNISLEEYRLAIRRNAALRLLVERDLKLSDTDIDQECRALNGPKVEARHIQVASPREAQRLTEELRKGASFETLAKSFSADLSTASRGGLLPPFALEDSTIPQALREAAFALSAGEVSAPVRVDPWYHILKLENRLEDGSDNDAAWREVAIRRLTDRLVPAGMERLYSELLKKADIRISDPVLREAYERSRR